MKMNLLKSTVLAASLLGAFSSASAETLRARIPFAFSTNGATMPAGPYAIQPMANAPSFLLFQNEETRVRTIVFARHAADHPTKPAPPLTFTFAASELMELTSVASTGWSYELNMQSTRRLPKGVVLTLTSGRK